MTPGEIALAIGERTLPSTVTLIVEPGNDCLPHCGVKGYIHSHVLTVTRVPVTMLEPWQKQHPNAWIALTDEQHGIFAMLNVTTFWNAILGGALPRIGVLRASRTNHHLGKGRLMADEETDETDDDIFRRLTEDLDIDPARAGVVSVSTLADGELLIRYNTVKREMYDRGEVLRPHTETGRDLSAEYHALLYEIKRRKLM